MKKVSVRQTPVTSHDEYLMYVDEPQHTLMQKLRATIKSACPEAEEVISYGMPAFKYKGRPLVGYAVAKQRCSLYPRTNSITVRLKHELEEFSTSKGTIRFTPEKPLPIMLVKKIVKIRMEETVEKNGKKKTRESKMLIHHYN
ncbi:DUF1801 domain-containing protein [Candidatus Gracilibacteria bacterium]|nr:DUF1801 domain-containing protein [Candidatus Gracilibacteria bacterium]